MSARDNGGPAFPIPGEWSSDGVGISAPWGGMTLRDYFAGQLAAAILAGDWWKTLQDGPDLSKEAYQFADSMLAARVKLDHNAEDFDARR